MNPLEKRDRNMEIYRAYIYQNAKVKDLIKRYGISASTIYHIITEIGEKIRSGEIEEDEE